MLLSIEIARMKQLSQFSLKSLAYSKERIGRWLDSKVATTSEDK